MNYLLQRSLIMLITVLGFAALHAQNYEGYKTYDSKDGLFNAAKVVRDGSGNYYVGGIVLDSTDVDLGPGTFYLSHYGGSGTGYDGYIAKYNAQLELQWAYDIGSFGSDEVTDIALTNHDSTLVVVGDFQNTVHFQAKNSPGAATALGGSDGFYAKYDTAGNFMQAFHIGGINDDYIYHATINSSGYLVATGVFGAGPCYFDQNSSTTVNGFGALPNLFIGWFNLQTAQVVALDTFKNSSLNITSIARDFSQNIYIGGYFESSTNINPGSTITTITSNGLTDAVMAKFDGNGSLVWHKEIGSTGYDDISKIKYGGSNLYVALNFQNTVDVDPDAGTQPEYSISGGDGFVGVYDFNGAYLSGIPFLSSTNGYTHVNDVVQSANSYYVVGTYRDTAVFDQIGNHNQVASTRTGFLSSFNLAGSFQQVGSLHNGVGSNTFSEFDQIISVDNEEHVKILGAAAGPVSLDCNNPTDLIDFVTPNIAEFIGSYNFLALKPDTAASNISFSNITKSSMTVTFTKGNGAKRIVVAHKSSAVNVQPQPGNYYAADAAFSQGTDLGGGNYVVYNDTGNTVNVTGLDSQTVYYFDVFEYNGVSQQINYQTANYLAGHAWTLPLINTGIQNMEEVKFAIYPNPVANQLHIQSNYTGAAEISVVDMLGQTALTQKAEGSSNNLNIDASTLPSGIYLCRISTNGSTQTVKFIKQ